MMKLIMCFYLEPNLLIFSLTLLLFPNVCSNAIQLVSYSLIPSTPEMGTFCNDKLFFFCNCFKKLIFKQSYLCVKWVIFLNI
jgi:hypothetical protein